jgi:hypothetical protein
MNKLLRTWTLNTSIRAENQAMEPIEFTCKRQGCGLKVRYERKAHQGAMGALHKRKGNGNLHKPSDTSVPSFGAYLICANGDVYRYEIPLPNTAEQPHGG